MAHQRASDSSASGARSLADYLAAVRWEPRRSWSQTLAGGTSAQLVTGDPALVYLRSGRALPARPGSWRPVALDPVDRPLQAGDFLFSAGRSPLALAAVEDTSVVVVEVEPAGAPGHLEALPDALTVRGFDRSEPAVAALVAAMSCATTRPDARSEKVICTQIATTVMSVAIRAWAERGCAPENWLLRSHDPLLARALDAMHADPARGWTLPDLARVATMSRTVFAERFREVVGTSPAQYLTEVRVHLAKEHLGSGRSVGETSRLLGYSSEDGFSRAFRRHTGSTPTGWLRVEASLSA